MKTWDDWSDQQLTKAVAMTVQGVTFDRELRPDFAVDCFAEHEGGVAVRVINPGDEEFSNVDYCNSWSDMGPLALNNNIVITPCMGSNNGDATGYFEHKNPITIDFCVNYKALRAAAIVFLMMNGVKPDEQ